MLLETKKFSKLLRESSELPTLYNHRAVASLGSIFLFGIIVVLLGLMQSTNLCSGGVSSKGEEMVHFNDVYEYSGNVQ